MTEMHILKDKTVNLAYRMYFECPVVLLMKTQHKFRHSFYHQILILARQRFILVTEKRFAYEYFSLTK